MRMCWVGEFDDVDLSEEGVSDLIEEGLFNLGFIIVEKRWDERKITAMLKSGYVESIGSVMFKKNKTHVSISISYEIIKSNFETFSLDEKSVEKAISNLEDSWRNLSRIIESIFSSGFILAPEIKSVCCPNCGRIVDWDSFFCKYCGQKINNKK